MRATASLGFVFYSAMEPCADGRSSSEEARPARDRVRAGALARLRQPCATGRLVESTQAEDRRLIALVGERPLLYARSTLPVASYYSQVKTLWQEVADLMGWTVAEVRRKWSHIRNSYSRHLRNEIHGMRTGRGRMVSRWYLADDLEFLRQHMATDTRPSSYSMVQQFAPTLLELECGEQQNMVPTAASWYAAPEPLAAPSDDSCTYNNTTSTTDSDDDYFHFFRGLYSDYQELTPAVQRKFRRQCLLLLHELVDATDGAGGARSEHSDTEDSKGFVHDLQIYAEQGQGDHEERGDSTEERGENHEERGESLVDGDDGGGTAYNPTMEIKPDEPEDVTNKPLPSMSEPTEVQDAVASTLATPFAQPIITASKSKAQKQREYRQRSKSKAQKQREYRQRIKASRTPAQAAAARKSRNERLRNNRLRQAANLAIASNSLETTTTSPSRSGEESNNVQTRSQRQHAQQQSTTAADQPDERVNLTNEPLFPAIPVPMEVQEAVASTSATLFEPATAAPKTRAQIQREYRQRIAASITPAQAAAAREARNVRVRNNRLRQAANLVIASGSLEATTTSSSRSGQRLNTVHIDTQRQFTDQQRQTLATEPAETTVQPSTSSDQSEVQAQSTWNTQWSS